MVFLFRIGREKEFEIPEFEKISLTPMGLIAAHVGKSGMGMY